MDFLKSAVASAIASGPPFPYTFGDRVDIDESIWTLNNGIKKVLSQRRASRRKADADARRTDQTAVSSHSTLRPTRHASH